MRLPGGDAATLYRSIQKPLALPGEALLFMCHDYPAAGREAQHVCTVAEERQGKCACACGISRLRSMATPPVLALGEGEPAGRAGGGKPGQEAGLRQMSVKRCLSGRSSPSSACLPCLAAARACVRRADARLRHRRQGPACGMAMR